MPVSEMISTVTQAEKYALSDEKTADTADEYQKINQKCQYFRACGKFAGTAAAAFGDESEKFE